MAENTSHPTTRRAAVRTGTSRADRQRSRPRPDNWKLSPQAVVQFIVGSEGAALSHQWQGKKAKTVISRKYYGETALIERCVVTLLGQRGLMLVGEPGTAKSMLSELLAAAISAGLDVSHSRDRRHDG